METKRLEEIQSAFFRRIMGPRPDPPATELLSVAVAEAGLFDLATRLQRRFPPQDEAKAKPVPEAALVEAIVSMAEVGEEQAFQSMSPRLRRAVRRRIATLLTVVLANEAKRNMTISIIPRGFPVEHVGMALLVTMGLEIPPDLRAKLE